MKINLTQNLIATVSGHGKTRAYINLFKIIENATCPCGKRDQTTDHLIFECELLTIERNRLKSSISQTNRWPTNGASNKPHIKKTYIQGVSQKS